MKSQELNRHIIDCRLQLEGHLSGYCPVQASGTVADRPFYFRARHDSWSFSVSTDPGLDPLDIDAPEKGFFLEARWGKRDEAGWMPFDEAERIIKKCAAQYLRSVGAV